MRPSKLDAATVAEMARQGQTDEQIGRHFGLGRQAVFEFRKRRGISGRPVGPTARTEPRMAYTPPLVPPVAFPDEPEDSGLTRLYPVRQSKASVQIDLAALRNDLVRDIATLTRHWSPAKPPRPPKHHGLLHVVAPVDLHVGKLAWRKETGEDYDSEIAELRLSEAVSKLLGLAAVFPVSEQLLVVGNDLLQVDNLISTTTSGTFQDTDSRYRKMFRLAVKMMADTIRQMMAVAPVRVLIVPGNHDRLASFHVGEVLAAIFRDVGGVTVDDSLMPRLYHRHGRTLLGFTHGNEEKHADLPLIMAQEQPQAWSETTYREFLVGHLHKKKETRYTAGDSFNGVRVSILESLTGTDAWHSTKGYVKEPKASQSRLYDAADGPIAAFTATVSV